METKVNQARTKEVEDLEVTPQHLHKKKLIEEAAKRRESNPVTEEYIELISDHQHKYGAKVRLVKRTKNGNVHRIYLGRYKHMKDHLDKWQKDGKKIVR
jgi:hypothetical protein